MHYFHVGKNTSGKELFEKEALAEEKDNICSFPTSIQRAKNQAVTMHWVSYHGDLGLPVSITLKMNF